MWTDQADHGPVTINLLADGQVIGSALLSNANRWAHKFTGLAIRDANGKLINYTVEELTPEGYRAQIAVMANGYMVINSKVPEEPTCPLPCDEYGYVEGIKHWMNDTPEDRPAFISVNLIDEETGKVVQTKAVTAATNWYYVFTDVLIEDSAGKTYSYRVEETPVDGYEVSYDGRNIINTKIDRDAPEYITITGRKTWVGDKETDRPTSIVIELVDSASGEVIKTVVCSGENGWIYSFDQVMVKDGNGRTYSYQIREQAVDGYTASYNGFDITNKKDAPEKPPVDDHKPPVNDKKLPVNDKKPPIRQHNSQTTPSPKTGDSGIGLYLAILGLAVAILLFLVKKKKSEDKDE